MFRTTISIGLAILFSVMLVSPAYSECMFGQTSLRGQMSRSDSTLIATWESAEAIGPKKDGKGKIQAHH